MDQYPAVLIQYGLKWPGKRSSYVYQRFFRAIYGYTQVVSKSNGKRYVYHRPGVLTNIPYVKAGKNAVILPPSGTKPLLDFLKTGKNPAHQFSQLGAPWSELVRYSMEGTYVDPNTASSAVLSALSRIHVPFGGGEAPADELLRRVSLLSPEDLYSLYYSIRPVIGSEWWRAVGAVDRIMYNQVQELLRLVQGR